MRSGCDTTTPYAPCLSQSHQKFSQIMQDIFTNGSRRGGGYPPKLNPSQNTAAFAITHTLFYKRPLRATRRFAHAQNLLLAKGRGGGLQRAGPTAKPLALKVPTLTLSCARRRADQPARTPPSPLPFPSSPPPSPLPSRPTLPTCSACRNCV